MMWLDMHSRCVHSYFGVTSVMLYALAGVSVQYIWVECGTSEFYRGNINLNEKRQDCAAKSKSQFDTIEHQKTLVVYDVLNAGNEGNEGDGSCRTFRSERRARHSQ